MLSLDDQALASRDPALPGLRLLLDVDEFSRSWNAGDAVFSARKYAIQYIRYKPGRRCIVMFDSLDQEGFRPLVAVAHNRESWSKLRTTYDRGTCDTDPSSAGAFSDALVAVSQFPRDRKLRYLHEMSDSEKARDLLDRWVGATDCRRLQCVAYKPARRAVFDVEMAMGGRFAIKMAHPTSIASAVKRHRSWQQHRRELRKAGVVLPRLVRADEKRGAMVTKWVSGENLSDLILRSEINAELMTRVGKALRALHSTQHDLTASVNLDPSPTLWRLAEYVAALAPDLTARAKSCARELELRLGRQASRSVTIHGDFYAKQICVSQSKVGILDFDQARLGDPLCDVGNFIAKLHWKGIRHRSELDQAAVFRNYFLEGYGPNALRRDSDTQLWTAFGLFKCITHPFRNGMQQWPIVMKAVLDQVSQILDSTPEHSSTFSVAPATRTRRIVPGPTKSVPRLDVDDLPSAHLSDVLDPDRAGRVIQRSVASLGKTPIDIRSITPFHHKPARRCVIRYDISIRREQGHDERRTILGKMRFKRVDEHGYEVQRQLSQLTSCDRASRCFAVPATLGIDHEHRIWFQELVDGESVEMLVTDQEESLIPETQARVASALVTLHQTRIGRSLKRYSANDEIESLLSRLREVASSRPQIKDATQRVESLVEQVRPLLSDDPICGIHRDFHPGQLLITPDQIYLLDFDLYCQGPRALDAGNYLAHLWELGVRRRGQRRRWEIAARHFEDQYLARVGRPMAEAQHLHAWAWIALARHIWISQRITNRRGATMEIISAVLSRAESLVRETRITTR